ncbi:E3 ubiquitin-protein ligase TRIM56-like [Saccostrea echinata]|uniref:E3 ubiquitin-protein ligase TRIM56-like n=1 Tax=Saccostrea echinata TaxID=191078 RepID=UPI002A84164F|nr:E3 ubiquitin-protein ligase TRIM56-like [Saccostrea echinata]
MASISTIAEEYLTCSICFELYTEPKTLPCLHSFCKGCIDSFTKKKQNKKEYPCPVCRETFRLSNNKAENLKTNFCLQNLIELVSSSKEVQKLCSFCDLKGENVDASSQCLTCKDFLCSECAEHRHRSTTLTLNHKIVSLSEVSAGKYNEEIRSKQQIPCSEHCGEDLKYFCETCDVPVCRDCIVLGHQNHKCVSPSDARKIMEEKLTTLMNSLKENLEKFENAKVNVASASANLEVKKQNLKEDLEKQVYAIIKTMMDSKKSVENEFDQIVKSKQDMLHNQGESIEKERKLLDETYSFCSYLLRCGSDVEILTMKSEMKDRLATLQSLKIRESCNIEDIKLPFIESSTNGRIFNLVYQNAGESKRNSNQENTKLEQTDQEKTEKETKHSERNGPIRGMASRLYPKLLQKFWEPYYGDNQKPRYTSVTWMNENSLAVVDQRNQKVKFLSKQNNDSHSIVVQGCEVLTSFKEGIACKTTGNKLHIINNSLNIKETFSGVSILLTCHPNSSQISWISGLDRICVLENSKIKEVVITDPNKAGKLSNPKFGHVLTNGMFVVSDWNRDCVFFIRDSGYIVRRKYCCPDSITSDSNNIIYVCDYEKSRIELIRWSGETLQIVKIGSIIKNPKSIAMNKDDQILIANGKSIVLLQME